MHINFPLMFEGTARIMCRQCKQERTVFFTGGTDSTVESSLEAALEADGWRIRDRICPECNISGEEPPNPDDENAETEESEDEENLDDEEYTIEEI